MGKAELRDRFIELRDDLSATDVKAWTNQILLSLATAYDWASVGSVHVYKSVLKWNEVDTSSVESMLHSRNPAIEVTYGNPNRSMPTPAKQFDVIIIPLLVFDSNLNRIGFGGGWYDRFLSTQPNATKIGLAYSMQQAESVPTKSHDVPLDMVVTQSQVFKA